MVTKMILPVRPDLTVGYINAGPEQETVIAHPSIVEKILDWKMGDPRYAQKSRRLSAIEGGAHMQRQITIELRVDYADSGKNDTMQHAVMIASRHILATARLLADNGVKPQIVAYSDDFYGGHEEIAVMDDIIAQGLSEDGGEGGEESISSELMSAARDS